MAIQIAPALVLIYQASLNQGALPDDWLKAKIVPIYIKGSRTNPSNYSPVSLTSICCKTLEHTIYSHIMTHLQNNNILCPQQHGFRHGRSCETQLIETIDDLGRSLNDSGKQMLSLWTFPKYLIRSHTNGLYINYTTMEFIITF